MIQKIKKLSDKYDYVAHFLLALFVFLVVFLIKSASALPFTTGFMLAIELTQIDIFGIKGRIIDTIKDIIFDALGIITGMYVCNLI